MADLYVSPHRMNIFFGSSKGRENVPANMPVPASLVTALEVFRDLDLRSGFMGITLGEGFVLQLMPGKRGIRIELLDTRPPAFDACTADAEFAESLILAAAEGHNVFQIARASKYEWVHTDMGSQITGAKGQ